MVFDALYTGRSIGIGTAKFVLYVGLLSGYWIISFVKSRMRKRRTSGFCEGRAQYWVRLLDLLNLKIANRQKWESIKNRLPRSLQELAQCGLIKSKIILIWTVPLYVPYFYIIKPTPIQSLTTVVAEELVLTLHGGSASWTLWKLSTPPIRAYNFYFPRPSVSRGEQKLI